MDEKTAKSLTQFIEEVQTIRGEWQNDDADEEVWFRGVESNQYELLPRAYRIEVDERSVHLRFQQATPVLLDRLPQNDSQWYFLAQHYGAPTRLLDWTLSPLNAMYFALRDENPKGPPPPCVWMMDAGALNRLSVDNDALIVPEGSFSQHWMELHIDPDLAGAFEYEGEDYTTDAPIAVIPYYGEPRIVAQQGTFTIHGHRKDPIETVFSQDGQETQFLVRIDLVGKREELLEQLRFAGIRHSTLFPELAGVIRDLAAEFKFPDWT